MIFQSIELLHDFWQQTAALYSYSKSSFPFREFWRIPMFMVLMLNGDKMINPRWQKLNLSKQPNNLAVMRHQSPFFPKKQPKTLLFWSSVSHLQAFISLKASETTHFTAAWVSAEHLSNTEQRFSSTESVEKQIYLTPCSHLPLTSLSTSIQSPKAIKVTAGLRQAHQERNTGGTTKKTTPKKPQMRHHSLLFPL